MHYLLYLLIPVRHRGHASFTGTHRGLTEATPPSPNTQRSHLLPQVLTEVWQRPHLLHWYSEVWQKPHLLHWYSRRSDTGHTSFPGLDKSSDRDHTSFNVTNRGHASFPTYLYTPVPGYWQCTEATPHSSHTHVHLFPGTDKVYRGHTSFTGRIQSQLIHTAIVHHIEISALNRFSESLWWS